MDVFDLNAVIRLNDKEYNSSLDADAAKGKSWVSKMGGVFGTFAKVAGAGLLAGAGAVGAIGKQAVAAYAEFEQLVGGVETLFGEDTAKIVQDNAANAFKTAGMSANQYMETVTSFSASLLQSVGNDTEKAAAYADMAIQDMSDNANKMGTSIDSIQTAYAGFAKGNFTMLDNLKLGYGGTKTEMERLILDAEKLDSSFKASRGKNKELTMSYADIVDAIHIVQDNMGITGATAREASTTIEGSVNAAKAAWTNLVTGLADDNADLESLINNFIESVTTAGENILPRVQTALEGISTLIATASETIIPLVIKTLLANLPGLIQSGAKLLVALITGLVTAIPELIKAIPEIVTTIVTELAAAWPEIKEAGKQLLEMLGEGIKSLWGKLVQWGGEIVNKIKEGILAKWNALVSWFNGIWESLFGNRKVNVNVNSSGGSHAGGLDYVPYNNYAANLHKGEAVLTRSEAEAWRRGNGKTNNVVLNLNTQSVDDATVDYIIQQANIRLGAMA